VQEEHRHRFAHDVAPPHDHRSLALDLDPLPLQELDDSRGRAGARGGTVLDQLSRVDGVKSVDVLLGNDAIEELARVEMVGERKLQQDRVDLVPLVQLVELREQLLPAGARGQEDAFREESRFLAGLRLARPGTTPRATNGRARSLTSSRISCATFFPSRIFAVTSSPLPDLAVS
jgi:hypothetical protein